MALTAREIEEIPWWTDPRTKKQWWTDGYVLVSREAVERGYVGFPRHLRQTERNDQLDSAAVERLTGLPAFPRKAIASADERAVDVASVLPEFTGVGKLGQVDGPARPEDRFTVVADPYGKPLTVVKTKYDPLILEGRAKLRIAAPARGREDAQRLGHVYRVEDGRVVAVINPTPIDVWPPSRLRPEILVTREITYDQRTVSEFEEDMRALHAASDPSAAAAERQVLREIQGKIVPVNPSSRGFLRDGGLILEHYRITLPIPTVALVNVRRFPTMEKIASGLSEKLGGGDHWLNSTGRPKHMAVAVMRAAGGVLVAPDLDRYTEIQIDMLRRALRRVPPAVLLVSGNYRQPLARKLDEIGIQGSDIRWKEGE